MLLTALFAGLVIGILWIVAVVSHLRGSAKSGRMLIAVPMIGALAIRPDRQNAGLPGHGDTSGVI